MRLPAKNIESIRTVLLPLLLGAACALFGACTPRVGTVSGAAPADALIADTGRVAVEGGTLYYEVRGSGSPVVLLHGGGLDHTMWDPQIGPFTGSFRVIRYDARGHGRSTAPMGPYSMLEDLRLVLDHLNVEWAYLVGLSMGAGVALDFAVAYPERVRKLALVSTSGPPPGVPIAPGAPPPLTEEAGRARLRSLSMPRMLVVGEEDAPDHLAVADAVEVEVPAVRVVRIDGGEHLVNQDAADVFNEALLRFLREE